MTEVGSRLMGVRGAATLPNGSGAWEWGVTNPDDVRREAWLQTNRKGVHTWNSIGWWHVPLATE